MLPPNAIFELKMHKNAFGAEASPLGELTALHQIPQVLFRGHFAAGEGRERKGRKEGKESGGGVPPLLFCNLITGYY